ncbi:hypothetical protein LCM10_13385 [Rossellomorea aquimaris]|uniref:hypothetical protein n=1 Tax=Rossellomorea aquimaris TaxID=189382 RepID=UPI001CD7C8D0|nr:hypothetical protein [Rossellomorea aquimaris]MCA1055985.1 hypothetical protein [Rossellomorea aquimaris]
MLWCWSGRGGEWGRFWFGRGWCGSDGDGAVQTGMVRFGASRARVFESKVVSGFVG